MDPYWEGDGIKLYLADCSTIQDSWTGGDVLVTDPPYGISYKTHQLNATDHDLIHGDDAPFDPTHLLGFERAVIFGANNFTDMLPVANHWIVWDKVTRDGMDGLRLSECEMVWTRGVIGRSRVIRHMWSGAYRASERGTKYHPTQKPIAVMSRIILMVSSDGDTIVDPYAGSGSTLVAARLCGRAAIGVEIDERYCEVAATRLDQGVLDF